MPRQAKELTDVAIRKLRHPGTSKNPVAVPVGGVPGLLIQITTTDVKSWILRTTIGNKRREIGLGGYKDVPLAKARERAREVKDMIWQGIDPIEKKRADRAALIKQQKRAMTFAQAVEKYLKDKAPTEGNLKAWAQWRSTLETYALPEIGNLPVAEIEAADVQRVLLPIWASKNETASRLRGRIENVLDYAKVLKARTGENPARWRGNLDQLLVKRSRVRKKSAFPALPYDVAPRWLADLRDREGIAAKALEFGFLCASRSGEVRGATWDEIDLERGIWQIPANRMKAGKEHTVPLSAAAIALLKGLERRKGCDLLFPSTTGKELSDMTLSAVMRRMHADKAKQDVKAGVTEAKAGWCDPKQDYRAAVPHGLRSTFRDWIADETTYPRDMAEMALAHAIGNESEASYRRSDMLEKRRAMMEAWAAYVVGDAGKVVKLVGAVA
jgi:integrase